MYPNLMFYHSNMTNIYLNSSGYLKENCKNRLNNEKNIFYR